MPINVHEFIVNNYINIYLLNEYLNTNDNEENPFPRAPAVGDGKRTQFLHIYL